MIRRNRFLLVLIVLAILVKLFSLNDFTVEKYYSNGIYPYIAAAQRILFGWIPFSVGDIFYAAIIVWAIYQVVKTIRKIKRKEFIWLRFVKNLITGALLVYVSFNILWGLNYNRLGIGYQLKLDKLNYNDSDLVNVTALMAEKMNALQPSSEINREKLDKKRYLFKGAIASYLNTSFQYNYPSVKPSIYSYLGNYLGFTGYYNPFSGEAQVNTTVPEFIQPFTTCHEIGHQLGYAKESEANFVGFLAASASTDSAFLYSVYFDMYAYAARYLYLTDSNALKKISNGLSPAVKKDITELREFYKRHSTPIETAIDKLYAEYLKANEQPSGKMSYNEVVGLLIAYYKKMASVGAEPTPAATRKP